VVAPQGKGGNGQEKAEMNDPSKMQLSERNCGFI